MVIGMETDSPLTRDKNVMRLERLRSTVSAALLGFALLFAPVAVASVDYTDIWYGAGGTESGWGVNFAQTGDFIFVTFFIYGPSGAPVWYTAQLSRATGEVFSGPVYVVKGTWFGAPTFPPVPPSDETQVGDATFTAVNSTSGRWRYRIDTITVNKNIERQTTVALKVADVYLGGLAGTTSGNCPAGTAGSFRNIAQFRVLQTAPAGMRIEFYGADTTNVGLLLCVMSGTAAQRGKLLSVAGGTYQCASGLNTTVDIDSIRQLDDGIEAHWRANVGGVNACTESGRLSGVKQ